MHYKLAGNKLILHGILKTYPMVAVTGGDHDIDHIASSYGFSIIHNECSDLGQGTSIALGVQYLVNTFWYAPFRWYYLLCF